MRVRRLGDFRTLHASDTKFYLPCCPVHFGIEIKMPKSSVPILLQTHTAALELSLPLLHFDLPDSQGVSHGRKDAPDFRQSHPL